MAEVIRNPRPGASLPSTFNVASFSAGARPSALAAFRTLAPLTGVRKATPLPAFEESRRALEIHPKWSHHQGKRIPRLSCCQPYKAKCYRSASNSSNQGFRFTYRNTDHVFKLGLEARKALASAPGLRTDPKGSYWCPIRRW
jgi:hypothetical protein